MEFNKTELEKIKDNSFFIFTHKHADHYSKKNLKKVMKEKGGQAYGVSNIVAIEKLGYSYITLQYKHLKPIIPYSVFHFDTTPI